MDITLRKTGIRALGNVPWGTHFCQFYSTRRDLLEILVPYFKAGLEGNEACMWICSDPLSVEDAKKALRQAVPDLASRLRRGQIEILPHDDWYLSRGHFGAKRVLKAWADKLDGALARGFEGLRLSGNTFWLEKKDWDRFRDYEEEVDATIRRCRMLALCTYSLDRCGVHEIVDVLSNHGLSLIRREGKWTAVANSVRKSVEAELGESQRRLKTLFESDIIGVITVGRDRVYDANEAFLRISGYDRKDLEAGRIRWRSLTPREFRGRDDEAVAWLMRRGTARPFEKEFVRKDGSRVSLLVGSALINRSPLRWECFVLDISKQKGAERALREASFTTGLIPFVILDRDFNFVRVNEAYAKACRKKVDDFPGHNHFEFFPNRENEAIFRKVVRHRKPFRVKAKPFSFPDHPEWGVTYWDWTLDPILDDRGRVEYLVFALNDVTEETRVHEEVRRNESLLREQATLLELASDAIIVRDSADRITFWNHGAEVVYGWPKEEALGNVTHSLLSTRFPEPLDEIASRVAKDRHWEGELVHTRSDGRTIVVESRWVLLEARDGRPATVLEINRDITARKSGDGGDAPVVLLYPGPHRGQPRPARGHQPGREDHGRQSGDGARDGRPADGTHRERFFRLFHGTRQGEGRIPKGLLGGLGQGLPPGHPPRLGAGDRSPLQRGGLQG